MRMIESKNVSSLEKIFPEKDCPVAGMNQGSALIGETFSYQIAVKLRETAATSQCFQIEVCSDIAEGISIYNLRCVPVLMTHVWGAEDDNYISNRPGLFPDVMEPYTNYVMISSHYYSAVWVDVTVDGAVKPGVHEIKILFKKDGEVWGESVFSLEVIGAGLPALDIPYTAWMHCDCISSYHNCEPLSERHWELLDAYIKLAAENGINMLLTPVFTPALDTAEGAERPTVQLVDVSCENGCYSFGFEKLKRWLALCKKHHIKYIEISHLYTQWGAKHAPKIVVCENGEEIKKFGWHTDSMGEEYKEFIRQLLPPLKKVLEENWDKENVYFHISDEPGQDHIEHYGSIYTFIKPLLGDFKQLDAMSSYEMYKKGFIETPVVGITHMDDFLGKDVKNLWLYYCCVHNINNYSNRAIVIPSYRNRIMGFQLYKYDIKGFLHWGYNFYYSQYSRHMLNPYVTNDADGAFVAGDSFSVYPAKDGAYPSIRLKVFYHGMQDIMAAKLLESYIGKDEVMKLIEFDGAIDLTSYPRTPDYILTVREAINAKIKEVCNH